MEVSEVSTPSRKLKRLENKKRKLRAYLELVQSKNQVSANAPNKALKGESGSMVKIEVSSKLKNDPERPSKVLKKKKKKKVSDMTTEEKASRKIKKLSDMTTEGKGLRKKKKLSDMTTEEKASKKKKKLSDMTTEEKALRKKKLKKKRLKRKALAMSVKDIPDMKCAEIKSELNEMKSPETVSEPVVKMESSFDDCSYAKLKQMKKDVDKKRRPWPFIELSGGGFDSQITSENEAKASLSMKEVQSVILHTIMPGRFPVPSRWGRIVKSRNVSHTVVAVIEGISIGILKKFFKSKKAKSKISSSKKVSSNGEPMNGFSNTSFNDTSESKDTVPDWLLQALPRTCSSLSPVAFEVSSNYISVPLEDLLCLVNNSFTCTWIPRKEDAESSNCTSGQLDESNMDTKRADPEPCITVNGDAGSDDEICVIGNDIPPSDSFDRRQLLLTQSDLYLFKYPVPVLSMYLENGFVYSKDKYEKVTPSSPMFGIDCEMCLCVENKLELASISIVNEELKLIYHKLVKPENKILNYLTQFSGMTEEILEDVTTTVRDVHNDLRALLPPDAILVGHSLNSDLKAMKMMHPYVIDTAVAYNLSFNRLRPSALQLLTKLFLDRQIQMNPSGHDPTEDAVASLELIQLKLKKGYAFGNVIEGYRLQNGLSASFANSSKESPENFFNIFQHIEASRLKAALFMAPSSAKNCHHILKSIPESRRVDVHILKENKAISQKAADIAMSKDFTFLYMKMNNIQKSESKLSHKKELVKLDKRLQRVFKGCCQKSLVICIFTGSRGTEAFDNSSNGLFMCGIKSIEEITSSVI